MNGNQTRFHKTINKIEFKMIRSNEKCWIKVVPLVRKSKSSSICFILNNEDFHWDIYDENGSEAHEIYFEGIDINPSFYLKSLDNCYRIDFKKEGIKIITIPKSHKQDSYIEENCNLVSPKSSCWAKAVYYTSRPDKPPFDEM